MEEAELRYPSLRVVIQYLEANKRIHLVKRCPCLQFIDKSVPLSLDFLYLSGPSITLNDYHYTLGVIRQYPKDGPKTLKEYQLDNDSGGTDWDLNQFGQLDTTYRAVGPGEIPIERAYAPFIARAPEEEDVYMEGLQRRLAFLNSLGRLKQRQAEKERIRALLFEWKLRKENGQIPYTMYLMYIKKLPNGTKVIEYLEYSKKLYEASKYLCNYLFADRKRSIRVRDTKITALGGVLRLPGGFRLNTRQFSTGTNVESVMTALSGILVHQNFDTFCLYAGLDINFSYNHPVVKSAKSFLVTSLKTTGDQFGVVINNSHSRLDVQNGKLTIEEYARVIDKMINDKRPIGTSYSFGVHSKNLVRKAINEFKNRGGVTFGKFSTRGCPQFPTSYMLAIDETSELNIYCDRNKEYNEKKRDKEPWILWIKVEETYKKKKEDTKEDYTKNMINKPLLLKFPIGYSATRGCLRKSLAEDVLKKFIERDGVTFRKEDNRGCTRFPYTYSKPITETRRLTVYFSRERNLNKKGNKSKPWKFWVFVEPIGDITTDVYRWFLDKLRVDIKEIGTRYPIEVSTKDQVKKLLERVKSKKAMTFRKENRGCTKFPYTYSLPLNDTSKLVIYCSRKKNYKENDATDKPWIIWHCVEEVVKKRAVK